MSVNSDSTEHLSQFRDVLNAKVFKAKAWIPRGQDRQILTSGTRTSSLVGSGVPQPQPT